MSEKMRAGWIGTGVMGSAMAMRLIESGYALTVFNRTRAKAQALLDAGAVWADSPREVAANSDIVFSIVGFPADVEHVLLGESGALGGLRKGGILCDMTTSSPALAQKIADRASAVGVSSLDAPVTGGDVGAKNATLSIFVGGEQDAYERARPCLEKMGSKIMYAGQPGQGQQCKLANQIAVAGVMFSVCESMLYARQAGLDVSAWLELVAVGAAGSVAMNTLGRRILKDDFEPGFFIEHFVKDLGLCLDECKRLGIVLPGATLAEELYRMLINQGYAKKGTQLLIEGIAKMSAKEWSQ